MKQEVAEEVFPKRNLTAFAIVLFNTLIYFICISTISYIDEENDFGIQILSFIISYYLLILSLCKGYISFDGLINNDIYKIFFNIVFNIYICIYLIALFIASAATENVNIVNLTPFIIIIIILFIESIYFYKFYHKNLSYCIEAYYKKLGASKYLNDAYKIRQKLLIFKDLLMFRIIYLLGSIIIFEVLSPIIVIIQIVDVFLNGVVFYFLQFHINCERKAWRIIIFIAAIFSIIKDIIIVILDVILVRDGLAIVNVNSLFRNISWSTIYFFILYYGYKDYKLFGSGLKDYLERGRRGIIGSDGRMRIE